MRTFTEPVRDWGRLGGCAEELAGHVDLWVGAIAAQQLGGRPEPQAATLDQVLISLEAVFDAAADQLEPGSHVQEAVQEVAQRIATCALRYQAGRIGEAAQELFAAAGMAEHGRELAMGEATAEE